MPCICKFFAENKIEGGGAQFWRPVRAPKVSGLVPDWKAGVPIGNQAAWPGYAGLSAAPVYFIFCEKFKAQGEIQALAAFAAVTGRRAELMLGPEQAKPAKRRQCLILTRRLGGGPRHAGPRPCPHFE